ncbi:hypothetical protein BROUX41_004262 [Berkeleyomyces rouxiae]|uniref:uncharacterized protein n=1 Tax=Berkeleyomyces rouxiae TaxID=2035830 RepID=UPI003B7B6405
MNVVRRLFSARLKSPSRPVGLACGSRAILQTRWLTDGPAGADAAAAIPARVERSGVAALPGRRLISVSGPDAAKFLNGAVTAEITSGGAWVPMQYAGFLTARGRVLTDVFIYADVLGVGRGEPDASFLIEVDANHAPLLASHIKKYQLRAKFTTRVLDDGEVGLWAAWDGSEDGPVLDQDALQGYYDGQVVAAPDARLAQLCSRILAHDSSKSPAAALGVADVAPEAYRLRRYLHGIAEGQAEIVCAQALPMEVNMDLLGGINFKKGCYVGQELTIRTRHRGVVRKRLLPCVVYEARDEAPPAPAQLAYAGDRDLAGPVPRNTDIYRVAKRRIRPTGKWIAGVGNIGLALCRVDAMAGLEIPGEDADAPATYNPFAEFDIKFQVDGKVPVEVPVGSPDGIKEGPVGEDGKPITEVRWYDGKVDQTVRVKPFVPEWMVRGLNEQLKKPAEAAGQIEEVDE